MRGILAITAMFLLTVFACVDGDPHMHDHPIRGVSAASPGDPPIAITINPEARVSATLAGTLPPPVPCGTPAELAVKVVNQGFVTAPLEAVLAGNVPEGATIDFRPEPLSGAPEELRSLRIVLTHPGVTDLTISFKARNEIPDLGGRDRIHFLLRCLKVR